MADFGKLNFSVSFNPTSAFPVDARYHFTTLAAAQAAAQGAVEVGSSEGTYFFGETVVVQTATDATLYVIQPDKTLKALGSSSDVSKLRADIEKAQAAAAAAQATADDKVASVTVGNGIEKTGTDTAPVLDVKVDPVEGNLIEKTEAGLKVIAPEQTDYTVTVETPTGTEYSASYVFKQLGSTLATINIPKDMVVSSGEVVTYTEETKPAEVATAGTYIVLTIANKTSDKLYINVSDLLDDKTIEGVAGTDITVTADSSEGPVKITATINEGAVQTKHIADSAVVTAKINGKAVTTEKIADSAVDTLQIKDNAVTTSKVLDSAITTAKINAKAVTSAKIADGAVGETQIADGAVTIDKIATAAKTTAIVKETASDTTVPTTKAVTDYVDTAIEDGAVQTVSVESGTNNGTVKLTVDGVATDNIAVTGWDTKADEVEVERIKYYGDPDIIPSDEGYFTVNGTGETITGLTDTGKTQTELVIPYEIDGKEITSIDSSAFQGCTSLTSVNIPNSVTSISAGAFVDCSSLISINIPDSVTSIGMSAFSGCSSLTSINIPNSVTSIGSSAFSGCTSLTSIEIPSSVTSIGESAFLGCTSLISIEIPNSVTSIGINAFNGCTNLTIYCEQGSYAETYAKSKNIPVVYTDIKATTLDGKANVADVYTTTQVDTKLEKKADKTYVDTKVSSVYKYKGTVASVSALPTVDLTVGDVYNVETAGTIGSGESAVKVNAGDNVAWTGTAWDILAGTVDLSGYQTKLTFDTTPTADSTNPVTSGGVKNELDKKLEDAPSDGKQYARNNGAWSEVVIPEVVTPTLDAVLTAGNTSTKTAKIGDIEIGTSSSSSTIHIQVDNGTGSTAPRILDITQGGLSLSGPDENEGRVASGLIGSKAISMFSEDTRTSVLLSAKKLVMTGENSNGTSIDELSIDWTSKSVTGTTEMKTAFNSFLQNTISGSTAKIDGTTLTKSHVGLSNVTNESKETMFTNPTFTGTVTVPTPTVDTAAATKKYVDDTVGAVKPTLDDVLTNDNTTTKDIYMSSSNVFMIGSIGSKALNLENGHIQLVKNGNVVLGIQSDNGSGSPQVSGSEEMRTAFVNWLNTGTIYRYSA